MDPNAKTFLDVLRWRVEHQPTKVAFIFLDPDLKEESRLTYEDLDRRAQLCAGQLQSTGKAGDRLMIACPTSPEYVIAVFACFYAGMIVVPVPVPRGSRGLARFLNVIANAEPVAVLSMSSVINQIGRRPAGKEQAQTVLWLAVDAGVPDKASVLHSAIHPDDVAVLQYTSGSTRDPKGVVLSHANLIANSAMLRDAFQYSEDSFCVSWLPLYHDMGLIGSLLQPLYGGFTCAMMSPVTFLQNPVQWLKAISIYKAELSGGPNFAYELCSRRIDSQQRENLDLSSWRVAFNGSEKVRQQTLHSFAEAFGPCGFDRQSFYICYGLAESTLIVSGTKRGQFPTVRHLDCKQLDIGRIVDADPEHTNAACIVSCGNAVAGQKIRIVNVNSGTTCAAGEIGELWISSPGVAQGYWNRGDLTREIFRATLPEHADNFLRTGDLGFIHDGELFITGRLRDLLIFRGSNHIPDEIEETASNSHSALVAGCAAAFVDDRNHEDHIVLALEVEQWNNLDQDRIARAIAQQVAVRHDLPVESVVLVKHGSLPRTSSGKIQRHECRAKFLEGNLRALYQWTRPQNEHPVDTFDEHSIEAWLRHQFALRLDVPLSEVSLNVSITSLGIDSLGAAEIGYSIQRKFQIILPADMLLSNLTISELAIEIESRSGGANDIPPENHRFAANSVLSAGERALWFIHRSAPQNSAYNVASAFVVKSPATKEQVGDFFHSIIERHVALRTTISVCGGLPVRVVHENVSLDLHEWDAASWSEETLQEEIASKAHSPFDLEQGPLFRLHWFNRAGDPVLLMVVHHIICDFWSLGIIFRELALCLAGQHLEQRSLDFPDYVAWQNALLAGEQGKHHHDYWKRQLSGVPVTLELPTDFVRPRVQTYGGSRESFILNSELTRSLRELAKNNSTTLYTVLLAGLEILLSRYTSQQDFCIGSPFSCRTHESFADTVGYFANTVVLRANFSADLSIADFIAGVHQTVKMARTHQDYPFSQVVEQLQIRRDSSHMPLVQALFVFHNRLAGVEFKEAGRREIAGIAFDVLPIERRAAQFDLALEITDTADFLQAGFVFNTDLFSPVTVRGMACNFKSVLRNIVLAPANVAGVSMLSPEQIQQTISSSAGLYAAYEVTSVLPLISQQVEKQPQAIAIEFRSEKLTYSEMDERSNQLARYLQKLGAGPEVKVGLCLERSIEMVIGILAVLKSGAAYVPLDPKYPRQRLEFMLRDAEIKILLTQAHLLPSLPAQTLQVLCLDRDYAQWEHESCATPLSNITGAALAYIIYTSGSTGTPKGVMNVHRGLLNRILWMQSQYGLTQQDCVLQKTPYTFDVSVWEFVWPLVAGARLIVAEPGSHRDSQYLSRIICDRDVTVLHFVPSMLHRFMADADAGQCNSLRFVICSGEALSDDLRRRFYAVQPKAVLENLYGPTEASIDVASWTCSRNLQPEKVPIGRPITNTRLYVLDDGLNLQPAGVSGEICIGGIGVARGYTQRPDLTAERFIPDPFGGVPGARLYRTGDRGRYLHDQNLEFLGRIDTQIKIRGYRIELGEIEATLRLHPAVQDAVVTVDEHSCQKQLVAYITGERVAITELRDFLKDRLPEYMVPSVCISMEKLPLSANGKLDRRALPAPTGERPELADAYVAPRTPTESKLAQMWSQLLNVNDVGIYDNFFELGGHSIALMQLFSRIKDAFGVDVPITLPFSGLFHVELLAQFIEQQQIAQAQTADVIDVLNELNDLSDEEVQRLLEQETLSLSAEPVQSHQ